MQSQKCIQPIVESLWRMKMKSNHVHQGLTLCEGDTVSVDSKQLQTVPNWPSTATCRVRILIKLHHHEYWGFWVFRWQIFYFQSKKICLGLQMFFRSILKLQCFHCRADFEHQTVRFCTVPNSIFVSNKERNNLRYLESKKTL